MLAAAFLADGAGPAAGRADPPGSPTAHLLACGPGFVGQVAVSEFWVFAVGIEQGVGPVRLGQFGLGDRVLEPPVVGLASYSKYPARHRDSDAVLGELARVRVPPFPGRLAWDRYAAARRSTSFSCSNRRTRRLASRSSRDSADVVPGLIPASTSPRNSWGQGPAHSNILPGRPGRASQIRCHLLVHQAPLGSGRRSRTGSA